MKRLDDYWYSQNPVAWSLLPLSWLFCSIAMLRRLLYRGGLLRQYKMPVPVIIVGNISVGGTGKTPLLIALCELLEQQGLRPGIVSRGYGGDFSGEILLDENTGADSVGDEPCLLKRRTGLPVVVGVDRPAAVKRLLQSHDCDLVLSDDGLQHYRLQRDLEIAVVDQSRGLGNGFCLPAGPLRETAARLKQVDIVAWHTSANTDDVKQSSFWFEAGDAVNLVNGETRNMRAFSGSEVHAIAGIGHPERFFDQLQAAGLNLIRHSFPDHHAYTRDELVFADDRLILMTEKDAVKCTAFDNPNIWYLPVSARMNSQLTSSFLSAVSMLLEGRLEGGSDA